MSQFGKKNRSWLRYFLYPLSGIGLFGLFALGITLCIRGCQDNPPLPQVAFFEYPGAYCVAYSPDGRFLAVGGVEPPPGVEETNEATVKIWELATKKEQASFRLPYWWIQNLNFTPDGNSLLVVTTNYYSRSGEFHKKNPKPSEVHLYDFPGIKQKKKVEVMAALHAAVLSADGKLLALSGMDNKAGGAGIVEVLDAINLEPRFTINVDQNGKPGIAFSPDGKKLAVGTWGSGPDKALTPHGVGVVEFYETSAGKLESSFFVQPEVPVEMLTYSPDGKKLLVGNNYNHFKLWDSMTGQDITPAEWPSDFVGSASFVHPAFSSDNQWLAIAYQRPGRWGYGGLILWDLKQEKLKFSWKKKDSQHFFPALTFSPDSRSLALVHTSQVFPVNAPIRFEGGIKLFNLPE